MRILHGRDLSLYQCYYKGGQWIYPDFRKPASLGVTYIILRLAVGDYYTDPTFRGMYDGYRSTGLYTDGVTPYIVWSPNRYSGGPLIPGASQVDYALDAFGKMGYSLDGPWTGDYEIERGATKGQIAPRVIAHLDRMKVLGLKPKVYTRASWWDVYTSRGTGYGYDLHVAHYTGDYTVPPIIPDDWKSSYNQRDQLDYQYSADGNHEGAANGVLSDSIDKDVRFVYKEIEPDPEPPPDTFRAKTLGTLAIRSGPGTQYPIQGYLSQGAVITVTERKITSEWAHHSRGWSIWQTEKQQWMEELP